MTDEDTAVLSDLDSIELSGNVPARPVKRNRKKVTVEWSEDSTVKLIAAVESMDFLWNAGHKDYKKRVLRNKVWQEMSENIFEKKYDAAQLLAKCSNLRIQFKSYHAKAKQTKSGQGTDENPGISWKYYQYMLFVSAAEEEQSTESESNLILDSEEDTSSTIKSSGVANRKRRNIEPLSATNDNLKTIALEGMQRALNKMDGDIDAFQTFGNFVAAELRKIPDIAVANRVQRTLTRNLMVLMDEADADVLE